MELLTVREAAARSHVSAATVYQLCADRKLTRVRVGMGRGTIRIRAEDLVTFVESPKLGSCLSLDATSLQCVLLAALAYSGRFYEPVVTSLLTAAESVGHTDLILEPKLMNHLAW